MGEQGKKMQAELEALRKKAAADLDSLRAVHQQESDASAKKAADAMSAAQSRHTQELQDAAAKSAASEKRLRSEIERLTSDGQSSMQAVILEKKKLEADLSAALSSNTALKSEVAGLKQQLAQLQSDLAKVSKERDDLSANVADVGADAQNDAELRTLLEVGEYISCIQELTSQVGLLRTHLATARQELLAASNLPQPNDDAAHVARMLAFLYI